MAGGNFAFNTVPNNTAASWWNDPGLRKLVFFMAICTISAVSPFDRLRTSTLTFCQVGSGVDGSLINGLQIIDSCRLHTFHIYLPYLYTCANSLNSHGQPGRYI